MTPAEKSRLSNAIYAAALEVLAPYETRGYNSHHAAQRIITMVEEECERWIALQKPRDESYEEKKEAEEFKAYIDHVHGENHD